MCFARTAALQGGDERQKVKASRVFVQHLQHNVQKCPKTVSGRAKTGPRGTQDRSRQAQDRSRQAKTGPRQVKTGQDRPKTAPRQAQDRPKQAQDRPKQTQDSSQADQDKPSQPQEDQDRPQEVIWTEVWSFEIGKNHNFSYGFPLCARFYCKAAPRAKNVPTCFQHSQVRPRFWNPFRPPNACKAVG